MPGGYLPPVRIVHLLKPTKMKKQAFLSIIGLFVLSFSVSAQVTEKFNSSTGLPIEQIKSHLQSRCWILSGFDVNANGWSPLIEGDGALVSGGTIDPNQRSGIYTPMLNIQGSTAIGFRYKFSGSLASGTRRWMKVYLVDQNNAAVVRLDSIEFTGITASATYSYNKSFSNLVPGAYRIYLNFQGIGGTTRFAMDEFSAGSPLYYPEGCNQAPVAGNDIIPGNANRTAFGLLSRNDSDPNGDPFSGYLITPSPHGTVTINSDLTFTFLPNAGFTGHSTTFTYQICDQGFSPLCSEAATVTINFPSASSLPVSLTDFTGLYNGNGNVQLQWVTNFEENSRIFEVERSLDGRNWETAGSLKAQGSSPVKNKYSFIDDVGRNTANRKDLFYRLKLVDNDGKTSLSRVLIVRVYNTRSTKMISVSPNPAKNDILATLQLNETSVVVMKVLNNAGSEIMRKTLKLGSGTNTILMDGTSKLVAGLYMLEVIVNNNERLLVKLIKE